MLKHLILAYYLFIHHLMGSTTSFWFKRAILCATYALIGSQHLKTTLHLASGLVSVGGERRAKWKWDLLVGLVAWQRIVVKNALSSFRQFLPLH